MIQEPSYYAVIPGRVRYDDVLTTEEKFMYGEISASVNEYGYCSADNAYFARWLHVRESAVFKWINSLEERGFITVVYEEIDTSGIEKRRIYPRIL